MSEPKYKVGDTVVVGWAGGYSSEQTIRSVTGSRYSAKFFYDGDDGAFGEDQIIGYGEPRDEDDTTMISSDDPIDLDVIERLGAILTHVPDVPPVAPDAVNTRTRILRTAEASSPATVQTTTTPKTTQPETSTVSQSCGSRS